MQEMQETQIRSLGQEDPLEEEMATHSNILARKIPWTEEPSGLQSMSGKQSDMTELPGKPRFSFFWQTIFEILNSSF